jgi:hypothetical protein
MASLLQVLLHPGVERLADYGQGILPEGGAVVRGDTLLSPTLTRRLVEH